MEMELCICVCEALLAIICYMMEGSRLTEAKNQKRNPVIFANLDVLVQAIKEYHRVSNILKGEYTLLDWIF